MHLSAIVLAAGSGRRMGGSSSKALIKINRKPLIAYSLRVLGRHASVKEIILVANAQNYSRLARLVKDCRLKKIKKIVLGGKRRQDSVKKGLAAVSAAADYVLIHDGARPFIDGRIIAATLKAAAKYGAAVAGVPVKDTIKESAGSCVMCHVSCVSVKKTLDRSNLWQIQTPQVFQKRLILAAYRRFGRQSATDDAMLVEKLGAPVFIVPGSYQNIKVTTPEDLVIAEAIAKKCRP
jgi:2-C-methyl-D-erythritol 4-phosphate cytidylyltransferase